MTECACAQAEFRAVGGGTDVPARKLRAARAPPRDAAQENSESESESESKSEEDVDPR